MFSDSSADRSSPGWLDCDWLIEISNVFNWDHNLFEINCGIHYKGIVWCSISNGGCAEGTDLRFDTTLRALPTGSGHSAAEIEWSMIMCRPNVVNRMISFLNTLHFGLCHSRHWLISWQTNMMSLWSGRRPDVQVCMAWWWRQASIVHPVFSSKLKTDLMRFKSLCLIWAWGLVLNSTFIEISLHSSLCYLLRHLC